MLLSDGAILSRLKEPHLWEAWQMLVVTPFRVGALQPCSVDVHLAGPVRVYTGPRTDTRRDNSPWWETLLEDLTVERGQPEAAWVLQPDRLYLAVTDEYLQIPEDVCGNIHGISSRARDGILVHQMAGLLDPGWHGRATLEISVKNPHTLLYAGQRIAQVAFTQLDQRCQRAYQGRYQGSLTSEPARLLPAEGGLSHEPDD